MVFASSWICAIIVLLAASVQSQAQSNVATQNTAKPPAPTDQEVGSIVAEEVVVESSLNVRNPSVPVRRTRNVIYYLVPDQPVAPLVREKRQYNQGFGNGGFGPSIPYPQNNFIGANNYDSSQSTAQSNSHSHANGPFGSQNADALAGAQAFQTSGPQGSFGATANNANTQTLDIGPFGSSGGFSNGGGQTYNLPNGQTLSLSYNNGVSYNPNGRPSVSKGSSVAFGG